MQLLPYGDLSLAETNFTFALAITVQAMLGHLPNHAQAYALLWCALPLSTDRLGRFRIKVSTGMANGLTSDLASEATLARCRTYSTPTVDPA